MSARGFVISTPETVAANQGKSDRIKAEVQAATATYKQCVIGVRDLPRYEPLQQYFTDMQTGKHSMMQLAMDRMPTVAEARLMAAFSDEVEPCVEKRNVEYERIAAPFGPIFRQAQEVTKGEMLLLVKRQQTWSVYFTRVDQAGIALRERLRTTRI